jgi:hypothetical protein
MREIADAIGDPKIERVSIIKSARIGFTTVMTVQGWQREVRRRAKSAQSGAPSRDRLCANSALNFSLSNFFRNFPRETQSFSASSSHGFTRLIPSRLLPSGINKIVSVSGKSGKHEVSSSFHVITLQPTLIKNLEHMVTEDILALVQIIKKLMRVSYKLVLSVKTLIRLKR